MERRRDIARLFAQRYTIKGELSPQSMEWLTNILIPMRVLKGTMLLNEGEVCKYFYYLDRGLLRQVYKKKGQLLTEHIGYEGSMIMCIESLLNKEPSALSIETLEPCKIYALPYDDLSMMARSSFEFCNLLIAEHPEIIRRTPLHIVASYLQMTPETLSRVRAAVSAEQSI